MPATPAVSARPPSPAGRAAALAATTLLAAILAACGQQPPGGGGFQGFPPAQVTTLKVEPATIPVSFEYVAQTAGSKDVEIRARVNGIVEKRYFTEGSAVRAGQPLFLIDPKPYEASVAVAEAEVARANAQKSQAEREAARLKPLAERRAIGQKEADDAQSNAELAAANVKAAEARLRSAQLDLGYTSVVAPIAGLTSRAQVSEGALAAANQTQLTTISQVDPMWVALRDRRERAAEAHARGGRRPAHAAEGQRLRRDGEARPTAASSRARAASTSPTRASTRRPAPTRCARKSPTATSR